MPDYPAAFLSDLAFVLAREGGYSDNPRDPGGATCQGVTQRVYDGWRRQRHLTPRPVRAIEPVELRAIYLDGYYLPATAGAPPVAGLALCLFDAAVNMGVGRPRRWLAALGAAVTVDALLDLRRREYHAIVAAHPILEEFLPGWLYRLRALRRHLELPADLLLERDFFTTRAAVRARATTPPAKAAA